MILRAVVYLCNCSCYSKLVLFKFIAFNDDDVFLFLEIGSTILFFFVGRWIVILFKENKESNKSNTKNPGSPIDKDDKTDDVL